MDASETRPDPVPQTVAERGVLFIGSGDTARRQIAFAASTVKAHTDLPVAVFSDAPIASEHIDVFQEIEAAHKRPKVDYCDKSPFVSTLYLDSDVAIQRDLSDLFDVLDRFDVAGVHDHSRKRGLWAERIPEYDAIPYAFSEVNGGVLLYRRNAATAAFFDLWRKVFYENHEKTRGQDQASLRIALWKSDVRFLALPFEYNVRPQSIRNKMRRRSRSNADEGLLAPRILHWHGLDLPWQGLLGRLLPGHRPMRF